MITREDELAEANQIAMEDGSISAEEQMILNYLEESIHSVTGGVSQNSLIVNRTGLIMATALLNGEAEASLHTVSEGETLFGLATSQPYNYTRGTPEYDQFIAMVQRDNDLDGTIIVVDQELQLPSPEAVTAEVQAEADDTQARERFFALPSMNVYDTLPSLEAEAEFREVLLDDGRYAVLSALLEGGYPGAYAREFSLDNALAGLLLYESVFGEGVLASETWSVDDNQLMYAMVQLHRAGVEPSDLEGLEPDEIARLVELGSSSKNSLEFEGFMALAKGGADVQDVLGNSETYSNEVLVSTARMVSTAERTLMGV